MCRGKRTQNVARWGKRQVVSKKGTESWEGLCTGSLGPGDARSWDQIWSSAVFTNPRLAVGAVKGCGSSFTDKVIWKRLRPISSQFALAY